MALSCVTAPTIDVAASTVVALRARGYEAGVSYGRIVYSTAGEWLVAKLISEVTTEATSNASA